MFTNCQVVEANRNQYTPGHYKNVIYAIDNDVTSDDRYLQPDLPLSETRRQIAQLSLYNAVLRHKENERRTEIVHSQFESDDDVPESECGTRFKVYRNTVGDVAYQPIYCHKCDECHQRKASQDRITVLANIRDRIEKNPELKLQYITVEPGKEQALKKRIQRDEDAGYFRAINEDDSLSFFVLAEEEKYGDVIEREMELWPDGSIHPTYDLDKVHDFKKSAKAAQDKGKRQTGGLFKKLAAPVDENSILVRIPAFVAENKEDQDKLVKIVEDNPPLTYAEDEKSYQQCHYNYGFMIDRLAQQANIPIRVSMLARTANPEKIDLYNENVSDNRSRRKLDTSGCPNKKHIETGGEVVYAPYLDIGQESLVNDDDLISAEYEQATMAGVE